VVLQGFYSGVTFADLNTRLKAFSRKGMSNEWCSGHVSVSTLDLARASSVGRVSVVLQWRLDGVTVVLQCQCNGRVSVSTLDLARASSVGRVLVVSPWCYKNVTII
jgi:hypothetical protein